VGSAQTGSERGSTWMLLYVVNIRREHASFSKVLADIREWLDAKRFEPDAFRCTPDNDCIIRRLDFKVEQEAAACAAFFNGAVTPLASDRASSFLSG
jgi:hypothetical protein